MFLIKFKKIENKFFFRAVDVCVIVSMNIISFVSKNRQKTKSANVYPLSYGEKRELTKIASRWSHQRKIINPYVQPELFLKEVVEEIKQLPKSLLVELYDFKKNTSTYDGALLIKGLPEDPLNIPTPT